MKARQVPGAIVNKYKKIVATLEEDVKAILEQERFDKMRRVADMEANKAENLIRFEDEIYNRPAKTWFQTPKEKLTSKNSSERFHSDAPETEPSALSTKEQKKVDKERMKAKDPFAGMTRKKRRRKQMMMEAETEAKENRQRANEGDEEAIDHLRAQAGVKRFARLAKAEKWVKKEDLDQYLPSASTSKPEVALLDVCVREPSMFA